MEEEGGERKRFGVSVLELLSSCLYLLHTHNVYQAR